jgi:hypothetical protein
MSSGCECPVTRRVAAGRYVTFDFNEKMNIDCTPVVLSGMPQPALALIAQWHARDYLKQLRKLIGFLWRTLANTRTRGGRFT